MTMVRTLIGCAVALLLMGASGPASAASSLSPQQCARLASKAFGVPLAVILVVMEQEGGQVGQEVVNKDGSVDMGPMQINSSWLPTLAGFHITREQVRDDACVNVYVGTWLLHRLLLEHKSVGEAIANYNSPLPEYQAKYLKSVEAIIQRHRLELAQRVPQDAEEVEH